MKISVIVCTRNRAPLLTQCLASIHASLKFAALEEAEILVVNNASTDDTCLVLEEWKQKSDFTLTILTEERVGISYARNLAFREAKGELLICTDDDCRLEENHIKKSIELYSKDESPVLRFGAVHLGNQEDWPMTINTYPYPRAWQKNDVDLEPIHMGNISGGNMLLPRKILESAGFYDECFGNPLIPGGEDADFGFRVYLSGYRIEYVPELIVQHYHGRQNEKAVWNVIKNYSIAAGALYAKYALKHPHICKKLCSRKSKTVKSNHQETTPDKRSIMIRKLHARAKIYYFVGIYRYLTLKVQQFFHIDRVQRN